MAACLSQFSIPYAIVERESCSASLWRNRAYDRLKLHLAKEFCELPHMSYPIDAPTYIPKTLFVKYLDDYVERFNIQPKYLTSVESSTYDNDEKCWSIVEKDMSKCTTVKFTAKFLVVASDENSAENIPMFPGLENFPGDVIHSSRYKSGKSYSGKNVLVIGSGNSGMEIAYDLATHGANTSIVIRSPIHVMTKELIRLGITLAHRLPLNLVDKILVMASYLIFGDLSQHGITRPKMGPMTLKSETGRSAVIDVGTVGLIKKGIIKNGESMLNGNGLPIQKYPNHWKGENGLYCAGLARRGLADSCDYKKINLVGMTLAHFLSLNLVGDLFVTAANVIFGDRSRTYMTNVMTTQGITGLPMAACLSQFSIPYAIVERESCSASLWRNRAYDRLKLHLAKEFCELPHMSYPIDAPTYIPKTLFVKYLDDYVERFNIQPKYLTSVESSTYDNDEKCWSIVAKDMSKCTTVKFTAKFLVVASGENSAENIPMFPGLENFPGDVIHSSSYKSGKSYSGKNVLVIGSGNSGMEIAYDLATHGANTSIVIRSPIHVMTKELIRLGMTLAHYLPLNLVDKILVMASYLIFGDLSQHGITRPKMGPMTLKSETGRSVVIDVGTIGLIKKGIIKVQGSISKIKGNIVKFQCSKRMPFDAIVFATGYKSTANMWLKVYVFLIRNGESMLNGNGLPIQKYPNHWKGENGLYCVGLARRGLAGIATDAKNIANDIKSVMDSMSS
ncbi:hypothetical protein CFC21_032825 [Triticum aestivum]|uniref:Flavin-containing monooxygenase n=2 Tax=Triticum aestivum TaxID=4565 RepID=A0A9R1F0F1_WHEAT|nr:hypothetical protein CFC21_032825 [Triticum aestivum]